MQFVDLSKQRIILTMKEKVLPEADLQKSSTTTIRNQEEKDNIGGNEMLLSTFGAGQYILTLRIQSCDPYRGRDKPCPGLGCCGPKKGRP